MLRPAPIVLNETLLLLLLRAHHLVLRLIDVQVGLVLVGRHHHFLCMRVLIHELLFLLRRKLILHHLLLVKLLSFLVDELRLVHIKVLILL